MLKLYFVCFDEFSQKIEFIFKFRFFRQIFAFFASKRTAKKWEIFRETVFYFLLFNEIYFNSCKLFKLFCLYLEFPRNIPAEERSRHSCRYPS